MNKLRKSLYPLELFNAKLYKELLLGWTGVLIRC